MKKEKVMRVLAKVGAIILTLLYFDNVYLQLREKPEGAGVIFFFSLFVLISQFIIYGIPAIPLYYYGFKKSQ